MKTMGIAATETSSDPVLGIDIVQGGRIIASDVNEADLLPLLDGHSGEARILLSPMGGQGFLIGRGNLQISPEVIRGVGIDGVLGVEPAAGGHARVVGVTLVDEHLRVLAGLDALERVAHGGTGLVVDHFRAGHVLAVLGGVIGREAPEHAAPTTATTPESTNVCAAEAAVSPSHPESISIMARHKQNIAHPLRWVLLGGDH